MKKNLFTFFVLFGLLFSSNAFAAPSYSVSNSSTITNNTNITLNSCDEDNPADGYYYSIAVYKGNTYVKDISCNQSLPATILSATNSDNGAYSLVEYDPSYCADIGAEYCASNNTPDSLYNLPNGQYLLNFSINIASTPTGHVSNAGIFFPIDTNTGKTTASSLTASVGTATSDTVTNVSPVLVVVLGIILGFLGIKTVIALIYETGSKQKNKNK